MVTHSPLIDSSLADLPLVRRGKVRDVYEVDDAHLLIVATDRISAFDYVLGSGIPDKGRVLTQLSAFWFDRVADLVPHHLVTADVSRFPAVLAPHAELLRGRSMLVRRTTPFPIECVARGYLSGSGWKDYLATGQVCGVALPPGLRESDRLPEPIFTPATKAESGHDENISEARAAAIVGDGHAGPAQGADAGHLRARRRARRVARHHPRRHEVRVRHRDQRRGRRDPADRRGDDARLVALLAGRRLRPGRPATQLRQAVRARPPRGDPLEQAAAGAVAARPRWWRGPARSTSTPTAA